MKEQYVILSYNPHLKVWTPERWGYSNEIVLYDDFYEALHDCHKGDRIVKYSQYLATYGED